MKTMVTGGTGFIGSHLVTKLVDMGRDVVIASDFEQHDLANLTGLGVNLADVNIRKADLTVLSNAIEAMKGVDTVYHLAAKVGSLKYLHGSQQAELDALQTNLLIDANVFQACIESKVQRLIYASSCAVYPMAKQFNNDCVFCESDLVMQPNDFMNPVARQIRMDIDPDGGYGWSKLMGEIQISWMKGIRCGVARIFNVYGINEPIGDRAHVVGDLIRRAITSPEGNFTVYGNGNQTRDLLYVSDCVDALIKLENAASSPAITVNIGSGKAVTIRSLAQQIVNIPSKKFDLIFDSTQPVGPVSRAADITVTGKLIAWEPQISLEYGLMRTYTWAKIIISEYQ